MGALESKVAVEKVMQECLGEFGRVEIYPTGAYTAMVSNDAFLSVAPQVPELFEAMTTIHSVPLIEAQDCATVR
jgi:hypothetical protein